MLCATDITRFAEKWANEGKVVIIAALDGTFQRRPFATVRRATQCPLPVIQTQLRRACWVLAKHSLPPLTRH